MLTKRKKSYGAFNDNFLNQCKVVLKPYDITHVHVLDYKSIIPGIYIYEPITGVLSLENEHVGVVNYTSLAKEARTPGKIVFLKHRETWEDMLKTGQVKEAEDKKETWENIKQIPLKKKVSGFLKKILKK